MSWEDEGIPLPGDRGTEERRFVLPGDGQRERTYLVLKTTVRPDPNFGANRTEVLLERFGVKISGFYPH